MGDPESAAPVVPFPRPVDRRLRLGPFASAKDGVKFAAYAATGALLAPFLSPFAWLPVLGVGFAVSVWRPDGEALDERAGRWAAWRLRQLAGDRTMSPPASPPVRGHFLRLGTGRYVTVLRADGTPLAYRPPTEMERVFRSYGELLRGSDGVVFVHAATVPLPAGPVTPSESAKGRADGPACDGYRELVTVLCRRRLVRRVDVAISTSLDGPDAPARLEQGTRSLAGRLAGVGVHPTRLAGRALSVAAHRFGWSWGGGGE
jgi:hypothetical protein